MSPTYLICNNPGKYTLFDHGLGFDKNLKNQFLDTLSGTNTVVLTYIVNDAIKQNYKDIDFWFDIKFARKLVDIKYTPTFTTKRLTNFVCSFNGTEHVSRQFLTSALEKFGWFDTNFCTKNFKTFENQIDGNISNFFEVKELERFYRKFVFTENKKFYNSIHTINYSRFDHSLNIDTLKDKINSSFVQIVSESIGTSYYPFVTEKFLYPVVNKTLWVSYAQPNWHEYVETYYGFKKYNKIFDYSFDQITNPVIRLVTMMTMLAKFEKLSANDWHDLYLIEQDTIDYNYQWYKSGNYLMQISKYNDLL